MIRTRSEGEYFSIRLSDKFEAAKNNKFYGSGFKTLPQNMYRLIFKSYLPKITLKQDRQSLKTHIYVYEEALLSWGIGLIKKHFKNP